MRTSFLKIILTNSAFFFLFIFLSELFLGNWLKISPVQTIPNALYKVSEKYDGSHLYNLKEPFIINYSRNKDGYRISGSSNNKKNILTIGGSTTDQRYVSDGETFQDYIYKYLKGEFNIINGGVDGQSTLGHIYSIERWHSKTLNKKNIDTILFLIGVNDIKFVSSEQNKLYINMDDLSIVSRIRFFISNRSFIYKKLKTLKNKFTLSNDKVKKLEIGHGAKLNYINNNQLKEYITLEKYNDNSTNYYYYLFKKLLLTTKEIFPKAKILVVQQQDPKCKFNNQLEFVPTINNYELAGKSWDKQDVISYCQSLGNIFRIQENVLNESDNFKNVTKVRMFIDYPVPKNGFYDGLHTNKIGSKFIADYLFKFIKE
ncbi:SGNH/GDSL hydrolase family protein [Prochlorococcus marinus XMU1412]|uniref:SGNH/GDSL hydrolase family protein n=1 Tax=Prochlorococcus marinus TaxID=1219 RepID=UPI001ADBA086|nr:SGNH/GDSL hydrolase family protein [Prochlorococcus marinus]MBO8240531.1 SGNH/GDSL hydrolase family protein [Prochlorococcus marinus XMU1412]MBW3071766.1 hypothetical protein [Prochlorococcus marinus str. MU1412]